MSSKARVLVEARDAPDDPGVPTILIDRPLSKTVWQLAWPAVTLNLIQTVNTIVDRSFISSLGTHTLAGHGLAMQVSFLLISIAFALGSATTALVARFYGAMDAPQTRKAMNQCVSASLALGLLSALFGGVFLKPLVEMMIGRDSHLVARAAVEAGAISFLVPVIFGIPAMFVVNTMAGSLRAVGDTKTPMYLSIAMVAVHVGVSAVLIFGLFGAPKLGITGSGIGFSASLWFAALLYVPIMVRRDLGPVHRVQMPEWEWMLRIFHLSWPTAIQTTARTAGMIVFGGILMRTAESEVAAATMNIGTAAEAIAFMPGFGFAIAASALVGQSLGAGVPERGEKATWIAVGQALAMMSGMALLLFLFARQFAEGFSNDPAVIKCTVNYLRIAALSEPPLAVSMVCMMAMQGAGDVFRAALVAIISMWVFRLPLAYIWALQYHGGANAAWWSMTIATFLGAIVSAALFRSGRWKTARV